MKKKTYIELYEIAERARENSYAPYSGVTVGAALLTKGGEVYTGANIENAAYGPTICAERVAIHTAVHRGERDFAAIAIAGGRCGEEDAVDFVPCGVCRQVMAEFCAEDFIVVTRDEGGVICRTLDELLPHSFDKKKL